MKVVVLGTVLFLQATFVVLAYITRDTLFVKTFGKDCVPYSILCISAASGTVLRAYADCSKKYGIRVVASSSYFIFAAFFCTMRLLIMLVPTLRSPLIAVLYMSSELCANILTGQFWDLCGICFDVSQSKRVFGTINFGATAGTLFVGFILVRTLSQYNVPTVDNLWLFGCLLGLNGCVMVVSLPYLLAGSQQSGLQSRPTLNSRPQPTQKEDMFQNLLKSKYQMYVACFEMLTTVARQLIDFQQFAVLGQFSEEEVKQTLYSPYAILTIRYTYHTLYSPYTILAIHCTHHTLYLPYAILAIHYTRHTLYSPYAILTTLYSPYTTGEADAGPREWHAEYGHDADAGAINRLCY
jgi:hypothetical protein